MYNFILSTAIAKQESHFTKLQFSLIYYSSKANLTFILHVTVVDNKVTKIKNLRVFFYTAGVSQAWSSVIEKVFKLHTCVINLIHESGKIYNRMILAPKVHKFGMITVVELRTKLKHVNF